MKKSLKELDVDKSDIGFLKKFKNLSEYRMLSLAIFSALFLPIITLTVVLKFTVFKKKGYNGIDFSLEEVRRSYTNIQYYMIFIDQIFLFISKYETIQLNSYHSDNNNNNFMNTKNDNSKNSSDSRFGNKYSSFADANYKSSLTLNNNFNLKDINYSNNSNNNNNNYNNNNDYFNNNNNNDYFNNNNNNNDYYNNNYNNNNNNNNNNFNKNNNDNNYHQELMDFYQILLEDSKVNNHNHNNDNNINTEIKFIDTSNNNNNKYTEINFIDTSNNNNNTLLLHKKNIHNNY